MERVEQDQEQEYDDGHDQLIEMQEKLRLLQSIYYEQENNMKALLLLCVIGDIRLVLRREEYKKEWPELKESNDQLHQQREG